MKVTRIIGLCRFACLLGTLHCHSLYAQAPLPIRLDPEKELTQYIHDSWEGADGLPQNTISAIAQTPDGYLWLGTQEGLVRFNGTEFKVYNRSNTEIFSNGDRIRSLLLTRNGDLLIGTDGSGLLKYNRGHFTEHEAKHLTKAKRISSIYEDKKGHLWIGTLDAGLFLLIDDLIRASYSTQNGLSSNYITSISQDAAGSIWIGTRDGLNIINNGDLYINVNEHDIYKYFIENIYTDNDGRIWISTKHGLFQWTQKNGFQLYSIYNENPLHVQCFYNDKSGSLWIGTSQSGLLRSINDKISSFTGLSHPSVTSIYEDNEGNLWIGTDGGGLNRLRDAKFTSFTTQEGLASDIVYVIHEGDDREVWFGTEGAGLSKLKNRVFYNYSTEDGLSGNTISSLYRDGHNSLWIGTYGNGLIHLSNAKFTTYNQTHGLSDDTILSISGNKNGKILVGTDNGVSLLYNDKISTIINEDQLGSPFIKTLLFDRNNTLWVGTDENGLHSFPDEDISLGLKIQELKSEMILTIHEDGEGVIWVGSYGGGLSRIEDGVVTNYSIANGLPSDKIFHILEDDQGFLWMSSSNKGILRVAKAELNAFAEGRADSIHTHIFTTVDGLKSNEMIGGVQPAGLKSSDGKLWFPTLRGVAMIDPENIRWNKVPPPVVIEEAAIDKEHRNVQFSESTDTLAAGTAKLTFHYAALSFIDSHNIGYRFKLEGFDSNWSDITTDRTATYTNLDPGEYTFRVIARNHDGVWNNEGASYTFYLKPYFYQTTWFSFLVVLGGLLITYGGYRFRIERLKVRQRALELLVDERTHDLRAAKEKIEAQAHTLQELDRFKTRFFANISHEFRTPLTLMIGPLENALYGAFGPITGALQGQMQIMLRNSQRLLRLINQLLDLSKIESGKMSLRARPRNIVQLLEGIVLSFTAYAEQERIELAFMCDQENVELYYEPDKLEKVFFNLLSNAVKFTPAGGQIYVKLTEKNVDDLGEVIEVRVRDTGAGIPADQLPFIFDRFRQVDDSHTRKHEGTGIGLALVKELVLLHGGTIDVESEVEAGTTFIVVLRKGKEHFKEADLGPDQDQDDEEGLASQSPMVEMAIGEFNNMVREDRTVPPEAEAPTHAPLILIVDDNPDIRDYIRSCLHGRYRTEQAGDGEAGLVRARDLKPDLILTDLMMPRLDGNGLCKAIRADEELAHIPIILLTAKTSQNTIIESLEHGADEYIAKPFNSRELLVRIQNQLKLRMQEKELRELNEDLGAKVQEQFHDLIQAKERAEESARLKTAILNNMSHEIRTPMAAILGYTQLLGMEIDEEHQEFVGYINQNGKRLLDTLNSILDLSRLESRNVEIELERVNLSDAATAVVALLQPMARQKDLVLRTELAAPELPAIADRGAIDRILNNLVGNAIKFTNAGEIVVSVAREEEWIALRIRDTGIGISQEFLPELFEAFKQESTGVQRTHEGSGLGLAITRHLVHLMGGDVTVESEKGKGSTFIVTLPFSLADETARNASPPRRHVDRPATSERTNSSHPPPAWPQSNPQDNA